MSLFCWEMIEKLAEIRYDKDKEKGEKNEILD